MHWRLRHSVAITLGSMMAIYSMVTVFLWFCSMVTSDANGVGSLQRNTPVPLLARPPGWLLANGTRDARVVVEAMLDLNCPDSANAWSIFQQLTQEYPLKDLTVIVHFFPLPYHRNSYILTQGAYMVLSEDPSHAVAYVGSVYQNIDHLTTTATATLNDNDVIKVVAAIVKDSTQISISDFVQKVGDYRSETTYKWKFATRRGVAGTPWYFMNGIDLSQNPSDLITKAIWKQLIDSLLHAQ